MINNSRRAASVWGLVSFLLLWRTFPADILLSWQVLQQFNLPAASLASAYAQSLLPALLPLLCFHWLIRRPPMIPLYTLLLPCLIWFVSRGVIMLVLLAVNARISDTPYYASDWQQLILRQIITLYASSHTLVSLLIIMVCAYAFWRERNVGDAM